MIPGSMDKEVEDIIAKYDGCITRRDTLLRNQNQLEAERDARKRALKEIMDEARAAGYDPDKIPEEFQRAKEVALIKVDNFAADLTTGENMLSPILKKLREAG